jgi:hypothetical protein
MYLCKNIMLHYIFRLPGLNTFVFGERTLGPYPALFLKTKEQDLL